MTKNPLSNEVYLQRTRSREADFRGDYFRDQTAIIHSMPFRRLKHKTQVFFSPENDHVCTRIEHVMHVATIAAAICKGLNAQGWQLDQEMAYAIGLCHDLGHAPFGHTGEEALNAKLGKKFNFIHEVNSYRVIEHLANNGKGLNLTYGVKDGAISHNGEKFEKSLMPTSDKKDLEKIKNRSTLPTTYEGCIVRFSDKIAYLGRDIEDAIIAGFISIQSIPERVRKALGDSNGKIIENIGLDMIESSNKSGNQICLSDDTYELILELKKFNYQNIYFNPIIEEYKTYCHKIIVALFDYIGELYGKLGNDYEAYRKRTLKIDLAFGEYLFNMSDFYKNQLDIPEIIITDYIAGMTDSYALSCMKQICIPSYVI